MLLDWAVYGLIIWGLATLLNKTAFAKKPVSKTAAWILTLGVFFVNLVVMTALQYFRYKNLSHHFGFQITPKTPLDVVGALTFSWVFFSLLRRSQKAISQVGATAEQTAAGLYSSNSANAGAANEAYAEALAEIEDGRLDKGVWARALVDATGDESKTRANYIRIRAASIAGRSEGPPAGLTGTFRSRFREMHPLPKALLGILLLLLVASALSPGFRGAFWLGESGLPAPTRSFSHEDATAAKPWEQYQSQPAIQSETAKSPNPFANPDSEKQDGGRAIHLSCKDEEIDLTSTVSLYRENGRLIYQEDSVVMTEGTKDRFGGTPQIEETSAQFRVVYKRGEFRQLITIDRITGKLVRISQTPNRADSIGSWNCVEAKRKM